MPSDAPRHDPLSRRSGRAAHLAGGNLLRSLTEVIDAVPGGINLGQGVCDLDPPAPLVAGAVDAVRGAGGERQTYTPYRGLPGLREVLARRLTEFHGLAVDPAGLCITLGSSGGLFAAAAALLEPGDEVVLFEPFYSYHRSALLLLGLVPVPVPLRGARFELDLDALRGALGPRTRALILNTPANPTGKVLDARELAAIGALLAGSGVLVLTDEVYDHMVFDGRRHVAPATVPGLAERCLTIGSFSKTFSATGWRVGYVAGPPATIDAIGTVCDQIHVCAPRPLQRGVERALRELPATFYRDLAAGYERRRDRFCAALAAAGFRFEPPAGAYYVLADYRDVLGDLDPHPAALALIERARVNAVPGHVFHARPEGVRSLRFHFAVDDERLDEACRRIRALRST
ncbi:MAG: aminotransferase class I/II-fold pyridoxal phosphate-dependent enzyme [Planctomycetes bacterium]|nr:aminotransferase class I/II-fold pyridoxal phosphate-dependent enzyme [Planctomycetota bacterium]